MTADEAAAEILQACARIEAADAEAYPAPWRPAPSFTCGHVRADHEKCAPVVATVARPLAELWPFTPAQMRGNKALIPMARNFAVPASAVIRAAVAALVEVRAETARDDIHHVWFEEKPDPRLDRIDAALAGMAEALREFGRLR